MRRSAWETLIAAFSALAMLLSVGHSRPVSPEERGGLEPGHVGAGQQAAHEEGADPEAEVELGQGPAEDGGDDASSGGAVVFLEES